MQSYYLLFLSIGDVPNSFPWRKEGSTELAYLAKTVLFQ